MTDGDPVEAAAAAPILGTASDASDATTADEATADDAPIDAGPIPTNPGDASLLALIDRLGRLLERSELSELAVEAGATSLVLRKPIALAPAVASAPAVVAPAGTASTPAPGSAPGSAVAQPGSTVAARPSVKAPLTGVWYGSPAPGSAPFVEAGREVAVGQVIGLIEAMKLFNEIKSDLAGRVVRVIPESGALVKAKQPLIEVEPL